MCVPGAHQGAREEVGFLELELHTIVSQHRGAVNQTLVLSKSSKCSYLLSWLSSLWIFKFKDSVFSVAQAFLRLQLLLP